MLAEDEQIARLKPFFPKSPGKPRVDDRRVLSGIIFVNRNGMRRRPIGRRRIPPAQAVMVSARSSICCADPRA